MVSACSSHVHVKCVTGIAAACAVPIVDGDRVAVAQMVREYLQLTLDDVVDVARAIVSHHHTHVVVGGVVEWVDNTCSQRHGHLSPQRQS